MKAAYAIAFWLVPAPLWMLWFDSEWLPMPRWAPPFVLALGLGKRWGEFQAVSR